MALTIKIENITRAGNLFLLNDKIKVSWTGTNTIKNLFMVPEKFFGEVNKKVIIANEILGNSHEFTFTEEVLRQLKNIYEEYRFPSKFIIALNNQTNEKVQSDYCYISYLKNAPTISAPSQANVSEKITIKSNAILIPIATGEKVFHYYERSINNQNYEQISRTASTEITDTILNDWQTVKYRIKAAAIIGNETDDNYLYSDEKLVNIIQNNPPTTPTITAPKQVYQGKQINVSCTISTDPDGDTVNYEFERKINNGIFSLVQTSDKNYFNDTAQIGWNTVQYRVRAKDSKGRYSNYSLTAKVSILSNQPPIISGSDIDLGDKRQGFTYQYNVTDTEKNAVTVNEYLDNTLKKVTANVVLGQNYSVDYSGNEFLKLSLGKHTIRIEAVDSEGATSERIITFTKKISSFYITLDNPVETKKFIKKCTVTVERNIPKGGKFKVEVTNNAFDDTPIWEDCTAEVEAGAEYIFKNKTQQSVKSGMNVRVSVERGTAETECWVYSIGGQF